jgi:hypothetical protein
VLGVLVVDFALSCRVCEKCGVDGSRGPKNPFKLPRNHPSEGEPPCFVGQPVILEEGKRGRGNSGRTHNFPFPFLFMSYHRLLDRSGDMSL